MQRDFIHLDIKASQIDNSVVLCEDKELAGMKITGVLKWSGDRFTSLMERTQAAMRCGDQPPGRLRRGRLPQWQSEAGCVCNRRWCYGRDVRSQVPRQRDF
jgi:hypothetical protein